MTETEMLAIATCCDPEPVPLPRYCSFTVPGQPVAKGRARFARRGNFVTTYTPEPTARYENLVKVAAAEAMKGATPMQGPIRLGVSILLQIPASWSKRKQAQALDGLIAATKKPDADNVLKAIKDGMNGVVYLDDAQAVEIQVMKRYAAVPGVSVVAEELPLERA
jgi:Holliday junction resolvase RusA-like endonuclease